MDRAAGNSHATTALGREEGRLEGEIATLRANVAGS